MLASTASRRIAQRVASSTSRVMAAASARRGYHENIVEHYENPRNVGSFDKNDENVGTGLVGAPACGDVMKLQIKVDDDGTILESKFKTFGCGSAIASSSVATEWVKGKSVDEVLAIKNTDIAAHLKLPPVKLHCSMLAEDAIKAAVTDWKAKKEHKNEAA
mmetsp:Transcript_19970/g.26178  ORF Transcript_19970/g.26178 Transcript_19970/m.26178 type:complete len:161 (-) Transcript_19970:225-707(-)|eukprot:CAMPEP_0195256622 /NCGR_PEP_ID=MMETSP0706-20130129/6343_1 /TAXON_ID=33640 /ORGANISM="Asterionellopsis glacialis, Strain CCMP134" /LENGTH=160 /DNA_ID=CAMNT_0040309695 /DNA_START=225 /DNA_END=707 /DNA_ORIENTATION=-